jgi:hypothetical protein
VGVGPSASRRQPGCFIIDGESWFPLAVGVGNNPEAVSLVSGANVGSWYAMPLRIVPDRGQVSENSLKPSMKQVCHVFHNNEVRS